MHDVNKTAVNHDQCRSVAAINRVMKLRDEFYQREFLTINIDRETKARMYFFAVAICHQTYSLHHPELNLNGWDYLEFGFLKLAIEKPELLDPENMIRIGSDNIISLLAETFSYDSTPAGCTLDRLEERTTLMMDAARNLVERFDGKVMALLKSTEGYLLNKDHGLYEIMPTMEAFADPVQKKTTFLIKLLEESGIVVIRDPEMFIPIMDYHMQRVLLRLGCVEVTDPELREKLEHRQELPSDEIIRNSCIEAFRLIAPFSGHRVTKLNDFFWSLGRSCCNNIMLCQDKICEKNPCTFTQIVETRYHDKCIFQNICMGYKNIHYRNLWQPVVVTHFY